MALHEWLRASRLAAIRACVVPLVADVGVSAAQAVAPDRDETRTARLLESIRDKPAELRSFLKAMPRAAICTTTSPARSRPRR